MLHLVLTVAATTLTAGATTISPTAYFKMATNTECTAATLITSTKDCNDAAVSLGIASTANGPFAFAFDQDVPGRLTGTHPKGCFAKKRSDGRTGLYYNMYETEYMAGVHVGPESTSEPICHDGLQSALNAIGSSLTTINTAIDSMVNTASHPPPPPSSSTCSGSLAFGCSNDQIYKLLNDHVWEALRLWCPMAGMGVVAALALGIANSVMLVMLLCASRRNAKFNEHMTPPTISISTKGGAV